MSSIYPRNVPNLWSNQPIVLYHGTTLQHANGIAKTGIDLSKCNSLSDFGQGFYTTTILQQATNWAWERTIGDPTAQSAVLQYTVDRDWLSRLDCIWFVDGNYHADDFWSLVFYCRQGNQGHARKGTMLYYDIVVGPVASFWQQRATIANSDQISFHSDQAIAALTQPIIIT